jgi:hypothetical protein
VNWRIGGAGRLGYSPRVLKSIVAALLLLTLPLAQARAMVVCTMEAAPRSSDCTCPHRHHGGHAEGGTHAAHGAHADHGHHSTATSHAGCCTVEFAPASTSGATASAASPDRLAFAPKAGDRVEFAPAPTLATALAHPPPLIPPPPERESLAADGSHIFLLTGRLRL